MTIASETVTAIVLCGGRGSRMGGRDKPLMDYHGKPMVAHICEALRGAVEAVVISANRNLDVYRRYGVVVEDELLGSGPLAGIASCLKSCHTRFAFVCPGDTPHLRAKMIARLAEKLDNTDALVAVAHDGRRRQNLHLLLRARVGPDLDAYLGSGGRSVKGWLETIDSVEADCTDLADSFADFDRPDDFA